MASISKRPDGKYRARYRDEAGTEHARHFGRKTDAQRWLDEVTATIVTGLYVDPKAGRVTFEQFVNDWEPRQLWETSTRTSFSQTMRAIPFGKLPLKTIRKSHIESWIKADAAKLAATTVHTRWIHVRQVFRAAVADKLIAADPAEGVKLPTKRRTEAAMKLPTPAQVRGILDAADDQTHVLVALCAFAGLRLGEVVAVKVSDIDFPRRSLNVQRQRQRDEVRPPKYGSERVVPLPDDLVTLLAAHVAEHPNDEGWLFVGERGPAQDNWAHARFNKARKAANAPGVTVHSLRHFYASGLIAAGCDVVTVQRALGHASPTTTLNTYAHLWPSAEDRTRTGAASVMADVASADSVRTEDAQTARG